MEVVQSKEQRLCELDDKVAKLQKERDVLGVQYKKLGDLLSENFEQMKAYAEEAAAIRFEAQQVSGNFDWEMLLAFQVGEPNYKVKNKAFSTVFPEGSVSSSGYNPSVMQYGIELRLDQSTPSKLDYIAKVFEEQLLPAMKFINDEKTKIQFKLISVLEPCLSAEGIHQIWVQEDKVTFNITRYRRTSVQHTTSTLREMLDYVQKNYAFGGDTTEGDEDED